MDLTTIARVKTLRGITDTQSDTVLSQIVTVVSARAEALMGRHAQRVARTEELEIGQGEKIVVFRGYPLDATATLTVTYSSLPVDTGASALVRNQDYFLDDNSGLLRLLFRPTSWRPGYVRAIYTGGMAADTTAFITAFPEVAGALDQQVVYEFARRAVPGGSLETRDGGATFASKEVDWLSGVLDVLTAHRRVAA